MVIFPANSKAEVITKTREDTSSSSGLSIVILMVWSPSLLICWRDVERMSQLMEELQ